MHTANLRLERLGTDRAVLWFDVADRPINVFSSQVLADFDTALTQLASDPQIKLVVLRSARPNGFMAGADIQEFTHIRTPEQAAEQAARGQRLFDKLASLPQTTLAVIHGPCLGGGLECALACDYRLVVEQPKTQLGLPEIMLGLLPAWGGTQRLPRVVGLEAALKIILGGKRLNAREARAWGLADGVATPEQLEATIQSFAGPLTSRGKRPLRGLPWRTWRQKLLESNPIGKALLYRGAKRLLRERVPDDMPAPWEALEAVRVGIQQGITAGFAHERQAIARLATTPASRNLIGLFLQEMARKSAGTSTGPSLRRVGVVGAGTMGAGIAQLAAVKGCEVVVHEVNEQALAAGTSKIAALFAKAVEQHILPQDEATCKLQAIRRTTTFQGFDEVDLVIEAVIEDRDTKRALFRDLEQRVRPTALLATNTSSLLVAGIQEGCQHPERVGGLHFFNPVHKMPLVEVVRAPATDEATVTALAQFARDLGKVAVVVKDSPGFLVNRILMPYLNEAVLLTRPLSAATIKHIDKLMRRFGMPMGPLELLDQVGLDVSAHIEKSLRPYFTERFAANPLFEQMSAQGWTGQKSGRGFYAYAGKSKQPNEAFTQAPPAYYAAGESQAAWTDAAALNRLVLLMVNEAAACLGEGIAADAPTIDLAMVFGTGWAPHRGGPLRYAEDRGLAEIVQTLSALAKAHGPRFEPCAELRRRAEAGETFYPSLDQLRAQTLAGVPGAR